ncbi:MAG: hypothetical protein JWM76_3053 [Pseudonocardiales bacterium]|nr:hypothetical protein [Pseudonocardiales bacterium]
MGAFEAWFGRDRKRLLEMARAVFPKLDHDDYLDQLNQDLAYWDAMVADTIIPVMEHGTVYDLVSWTSARASLPTAESFRQRRRARLRPTRHGSPTTSPTRTC